MRGPGVFVSGFLPSSDVLLISCRDKFPYIRENYYDIYLKLSTFKSKKGYFPQKIEIPSQPSKAYIYTSNLNAYTHIFLDFQPTEN